MAPRTLKVCHAANNFGTGFLSVVEKLFDQGAISSNRTVCPSEVQTIALDDYVERERIGKIGLLKMDIEGSEGLALKGFSRTLRTAPPQFIILEFFAKWLNSTDVGAVQARTCAQACVRTCAQTCARHAPCRQRWRAAVVDGPNVFFLATKMFKRRWVCQETFCHSFGASVPKGLALVMLPSACVQADV